MLPALRTRLGIDAGTLAVLLFIVGVAAVVSMQVGGRMADRVGARRVTLTALPLMIAGAAVLAFAGSFPLAVVAGVLLGLGNGATDVAMNALGVAVEKARPMPVMSRFHAFWSIGSFGGAAVVFLSAWLVGDENGSVILPAMLAIVVLAAVGLLVTLRWIPETEPVSHTVDGRKEPIPRVAWLLGAMAVCFGLMEGTAYDWSGVHMADVAGVEPGTASIAVVTVTLFMVAMRLAGDWAVARFGHRPVVWFGAVAAAIGYAVTVFATAVPVLLVGWAFVGFGVAMIAPQVYATSGYLGGGRMLAVVVTFGYAAFLSGPAVLGWLVHTFGVQKAMLLPFALSFVLGRHHPMDAGDRAGNGRARRRAAQGRDGLFDVGLVRGPVAHRDPQDAAVVPAGAGHPGAAVGDEPRADLRGPGVVAEREAHLRVDDVVEHLRPGNRRRPRPTRGPVGEPLDEVGDPGPPERAQRRPHRHPAGPPRHLGDALVRVPRSLGRRPRGSGCAPRTSPAPPPGRGRRRSRSRTSR